MRYVELFAGAGGLSMGLEAAGMHPVAHAEIEPHARAVLRRHWPDTPLHGDVTQVDWTQYAGQVDLVAGGSPCQDLSVAGKRAGLAGVRSGLFYELIRAWDETGATYCLWENVDGARSSNKGEDFAAVLSAFVGAPVAVPGTGRWTSAGVVAGSTGVAAWRVLDLQHFGPPQRRRRIFVVAARTGGVDPAELLLEPSGVCGHPSPREQSRQGAARGAAGGVGGGAEGGVVPIGEAIARQGKPHGSSAMIGAPGDPMFTLTSKQHAVALGVESGVMARDHVIPTLGVNNFKPTKSTSGAQADLCIVQPSVLATHALTHEGADGRPIAFTTTQTPKVGGDVALTLEAASRSGGGQTPAVLTFQQSSLTGRGTMGVDENTTVLRPVKPQADHQMICLASGQANAEVVRDGVPTLNTIHEQPIVTGAAYAGRPRRLTPLECERLMGWPDRHTSQGVREDGTAYALSDTARYRLCGNGVGTPVAAWIATRLVAAVEGACPP